MSGSFHHSRKRKAIIGVAFTGYALAPLFCKLEGLTAQAYSVLDKSAWIALAALRPVIQLTGWPWRSAYLFENAGLLHCAGKILAGLWPLLCVLARLSVK
jgi:hypothetical protein